MSCGRARRLLWPDAGPREATREVVLAQDHAARCEACREFLLDMRRVSHQIGQAAPRPAAPPEVRDRLFEAIARVRTASELPKRITRLRQTTFAGIAALLVIGVSWLGYLALRDSNRGSAAIAAIVDDRLRTQTGSGLMSSDSLEVAGWLAERLPFAVQIPLFPEARLVGARLLVDNRRSGAAVDYAVDTQILTYYVLPGAGAGLPRRIELASRDGYRVASWHDSGLTHALVAILPGPRLIEYARYCMHQMMA